MLKRKNYKDPVGQGVQLSIKILTAGFEPRLFCCCKYIFSAYELKFPLLYDSINIVNA